MTALDLRNELSAIRRRTRKLLYVSIGAHILVLLWLALMQHFVPEPPGLTEITWIDPAELQAATPPPAVAKAEPMEAPQYRPSLDEKNEKFERQPLQAQLEPEPQRIQAIEDKLNERLATLQQEAVRRTTDVAAVSTPSPVRQPRLAGVSDEVYRPSRPAELAREDGQAPAPIPLGRTETRVQKAISAPSSPLADLDRAKPDRMESEVRRTLAGAQMTGPVADRPIISYNKPVYPDWAKVEGIEGSVMIYFVVLPDGRVKENVMVQKTSGFADFDGNAVAAILTWRFQPLASGKTGEQWGTIMFHYRLE